MVTKVFVMTFYDRWLTKSPWTQTALIVKGSFTEQDWQERVEDTKEFFEAMNFVAVNRSEIPDKTNTIGYVSRDNRRKVVYQVQEKSVREQQIKDALIEALTEYEPDMLIEILKDNFTLECFGLDRFGWKNGADFLNQTTLEELQHALDTIDPKIISDALE